MKRLVALYRSPTYSPEVHRRNDTAILDATVAGLQRRGWNVTRTGEGDVVAGRLPAAELYVNMCQGPAASERLLNLVPRQALAVNPPESVLNCHRHRLVSRMEAAGLPFPRTLIVPTAEPRAVLPLVHQLNGDGRPVWVKRGDVHAETSADVVAAKEAGVTDAIAGFARRGVARVALQAHVAGPIVKFYAVADGRFFSWYSADGSSVSVSEKSLRTLVFAAARAVGLEVFGGDVAFPKPDAPVLIDLNDWPSFAPVRVAAAAAIAAYIDEKATNGKQA
jgi:glutathione synthase/RimK-type ligase-like ATP-grasp enzyme